jgi:hypothetical protein
MANLPGTNKRSIIMAVIYRYRRGEHPDPPLTPQELAAIAARHRDATPGPWGWSDWADGSAGYDGPDLMQHCSLGPDDEISRGRQWSLSHEGNSLSHLGQVLVIPETDKPLPRAGDATFLAHSWEDVGRLLATVRAKDAEIARLRKGAAPVQGDPDSFISNEGQAQDGVTTAIRAQAYFLRHDLAALDEALVHWTLSDVAGAELIVRLDRAGVAVRRMTDQLTLPKLRQKSRRDKRGARA